MKKLIFLIYIISTPGIAQTILRVPSEYPTIQEAITASQNRDTVLVDEGVYLEEIDFDGKNILISSNFLFDAEITHVNNTIIKGNTGAVVSFLNGEDSTCMLNGFTITGGFLGILCYHSSPIIANCIIKDMASLSHFDFGIGIECRYSNATIWRCAIVNNRGLFGSFGYASGILAFAQTDSVYTIKIINSTIALNDLSYGSGVKGFKVEFIIINSIIWNRTGQSIEYYLTPPVVSYSDIKNGWIGEGNIDEYPMFADTASGNYSLLENSPCIDAGTSFFVLQGDTIINLPPQSYQGIAPDMGFLESPNTSEVSLIFTQPKSYSLHQNYPNPFNPSTKIKFEIPGQARNDNTLVTLKVYDILGNEVATLVNEELQAGEYEVEFSVGRDSSPDVVSGIYFYHLKSGSFIQTKKMVLLK